MSDAVARDLQGERPGFLRQGPMRTSFLIRFLDLMLATAVFVALT
jgi:hypothetical protein